MKTKQIMMREFSGKVIRQNHLTGMFSATDMVSIFPSKNLPDWKNKQSTKDFIEIIQYRENLEIEQVLLQTGKKRGDDRGMWLHPLLAVDLAIWLSPDFKYDVLSWVHDNLCVNRDKAGESYKLMCNAIAGMYDSSPRYFIRECDMVQELARIERGKRNESDSDKLAKLYNLEKWNAKLMERGENDFMKRKRILQDFLAMDE